VRQFLERKYSISGAGIVVIGLLFILNNLFAGFIKASGNDLYTTSKQAIQNSTTDTLQLIGIIIVIVGFSWLGYGYWKTKRNGKNMSCKNLTMLVTSKTH
jgi:uncharacterized membrane protein YidH (DUF202 family)